MAPGGTFFTDPLTGSMFRIAQDVRVAYGRCALAHKVYKFTATEYIEEIVDYKSRQTPKGVSLVVQRTGLSGPKEYREPDRIPRPPFSNWLIGASGEGFDRFGGHLASFINVRQIVIERKSHQLPGRSSSRQSCSRHAPLTF